MLKAKVFCSHVILVGSHTSTGFIKFLMIIIRDTPEQSSYAAFLYSKYFTYFVSRQTTPAANTVAEVGHKQCIIKFRVLTSWNTFTYSLNGVNTAIELRGNQLPSGVHNYHILKN